MFFLKRLFRAIAKMIWHGVKYFLLMCGVPMERILEIKIKLLCIYHKIYHKENAVISPPPTAHANGKWTLEHNLSNAVRTDEVWQILDSCYRSTER